MVGGRGLLWSRDFDCVFHVLPLATLTRTRAELAAALDGDVAPRTVVMTMGALHQGHFDLVAEAARRVGPSGTVVVTIFLNPLQFAPGRTSTPTRAPWTLTSPASPLR